MAENADPTDNNWRDLIPTRFSWVEFITLVVCLLITLGGLWVAVDRYHPHITGAMTDIIGQSNVQEPDLKPRFVIGEVFQKVE